jgi:hypothetical protein
MNLQFVLVSLGIILLAIPTTVLCGAGMRARLNRPVRRFTEGLGPLALSWMNWFDLARGAAGAWLIQHALQDTIASGDELASTFLGIELGVYFLCVLAQTVWIRRPVRIVGPFFFMAGLTLVVSGPLTGGFALVVGLCCALMIGRLSSVFWFVSAGLVGFALLFHRVDLVTAFNALVFLVPAMLAFRFGTRISFMRRPEVEQARARKPQKARPEEVRVAAIKKPEPLRAQPAKPEPHRPQPVKAEPLRPLIKAEPVQAEPARTESARGMGTIIQTDFAAPSAKTTVLVPAAALPAPAVPVRRVAGERAPIPDFLRIAEDPQPVRRKIRIRIARRGA